MRKYIIILFTILLALMFCGCADESQSTTDGSDAISIPQLSCSQSETAHRVGEPYSGSISFSERTMDYESEFALYHFDCSIKQSKRDECVYYSDELLRRLGLDEKPEILVISDYSGAWTQEGKIYLGEQDFNSAEFGAQLLSLACGGWTNYGAAYGYAEHVAADCGWRQVDIAMPELTESNARDLNCICFSEQFVAAEDVVQNKEIAKAFVQDYIEQNGEDAFVRLLKASGSPETVSDFNAELTAWYSENCLEYTPSEIIYAIGGEYHEYWARSVYATYYLPVEWYNSFRSEIITDNSYLHDDYDDVKFCFETNTYQMEYLQDYFGFESYRGNVDVEFHNHGSSGMDFRYNVIKLDRLDSLMHEYIHWILRDYLRFTHSNYVDWLDEGYTEYVATTCPNVYKQAGLLYSARCGNPTYDNQPGDWFKLYQEIVGEEDDPYVCWEKRWDFITYYFDEYTGGGVGLITSFPNYLINKYGIDAFKDYAMLTGNDVPDWDIGALKDEWRAYIEELYAEYPKFSDYEG